MINKPPRLKSLDILRGFDLFMLVALVPILFSLPINSEYFAPIKHQLNHVDWEGFAVWDLVMPLFMFMSGITIPFSLYKYREGIKSASETRSLWLKILKRVLILWVLGMVVQGNLLDIDFSKLKFYSNTLQAIAIGYLFSAIIFIYCKRNTRYIIAVSMLLVYWLLLAIYGNYTPEGNFAEMVDKAILRQFRDGAFLDDSGNIVFSESYHYTWIISSINFIVTVLTGVFAGDFLKNSNKKGMNKVFTLLICGIIMVLIGWIWGIYLPVIKKIWTSSMVMVSSGYCFILTAIFYWIIDIKGVKCLDWLQIYGKNSIVAYVITSIGLFTGVTNFILEGLKQYTGEYYNFILELSTVLIIYFILYILYKNNKFLKV